MLVRFAVESTRPPKARALIAEKVEGAGCMFARSSWARGTAMFSSSAGAVLRFAIARTIERLRRFEGT
jgi:hypothetical protein